ncbi:hypothetical protein BO221_14450 [Archangium sp. Cb G35]|uniref:hypothetical protein n=1 Tax=Archangium sp. Cb G35 TaxID=1920190 RepID=UPI00093617F1|nr:hypothetical protein [Archangium sp. Cb G35]OJT24364.1 hypothetical protein BO221_14450 [Archangium sp. Cb G35]
MSIKRMDGGGASNAAQAAAQAAREAAAQAAREAAARAAREAAAQAAAQAARAAAQQSQSSFQPQAARNTLKLDGNAAPPASSLFTENNRDGSVNCLDQAADFISKSTPQLQARSEMVFLEDQRAGQEGQTGHVVVRQGERILDPSSGKSYDDMQAYLREQPQYREVGSIPGTTAAKIFATEPGSPERAKALASANVSPELQRMMVADQPPSVPDNLPDPANPQDYNVSTGSAQVGPVTVNYPDQPGPVQVEFSSSLESEVEREDGYVTVTMNAETSVSATGELELKAVSVGGGVSAGNQMTYEVRMSEADFERMRRGEIPPPHPLDPNTLPDGGSVRLEQSQFTGTSMEAGVSYHAAELGMSSDIREGEGMMIEMRRTGDSVQVTAGPKQFIENEGKISVGVGPVSVSAGRTDTLTNYQLRTATFDLSNPQGQEAYNSFRTTGRMPEQDGAGVSNALHLERVTYESQSEFGLELGPIELSAEGATNTGDLLITHHPDGTTTRSLDLVYGGDHPDLNISQRFDQEGNLIPGSESYTYKFDTDDPNMREIMVYAYTGDEAQAKAARDSDEPLVLTLTREQMQQLQERAREQPMGHMGLGGLLSDYDGNPLDPTQAASILAGSPVYNEFRVVQELFGLSDGGNNPPPGTLQIGD